jgi:formylglycine-generating enzyme required for sulfatase activity
MQESSRARRESVWGGRPFGRSSLVAASTAVAVFLLVACKGTTERSGSDPHAAHPENATMSEQGGVWLVEIAGGTFMMGSPEPEPGRHDSEGQQHEVTISPFLLSKYEVTNEQYRRFVEATGHVAPTLWGQAKFQRLTRPQHPVVGVSWDDANAFAQWAGGRLPTEAEWEYACRAGTTTAFSFGDSITPDQVHYEDALTYAAGKRQPDTRSSVPVGSLPANAWGLHEMHGNVWEWCGDWYGSYGVNPSVNPHGAASGPGHVRRGGSWLNPPEVVRAATRAWYPPEFRHIGLGFRMARAARTAGE